MCVFLKGFCKFRVTSASVLLQQSSERHSSDNSDCTIKTNFFDGGDGDDTQQYTSRSN